MSAGFGPVDYGRIKDSFRQALESASAVKVSLSGENVVNQKQFNSGVDFVHTGDTTGSYLADNSIPNGSELMVQANYSNEANVLVGFDDDPSIQLSQGQAINFFTTNTANIYVKLGDASDSVNVAFEE